MVRLADTEIAQLMHVAREIRDTLDERGYRVKQAVDKDKAFGRNPASAKKLARDLVVDGALRGAEGASLATEESSNGLDLVAMSPEGVIRRYRLKRVKAANDGGYEAICNASSTLLTSETDSFFREEKWLLGFIVSNDHTVEDLFAAEIVGWHGEGSGPVTLRLGPSIDLSQNSTPPSPGFTSTEEGLEGFEDDDEAGTADGS